MIEDVLPLTFTVVFIPGVDTILNPVAHQRVVDAHVAVAEERVAGAGGWRCETKQTLQITFTDCWRSAITAFTTANTEAQ